MIPIKFNELEPKTSDERLAIERAMTRVMNSGRYIGGIELQSFEGEWADYTEQRYCVGVASGFHAIKLIVRALNLLSGAVFAVPANTCAPTFAAVQDAGSFKFAMPPLPPAWPVFRQGDEWQIEVLKPDVFVRVHLYGVISDCRPNVPFVIDDACQAHGTAFRQIPAHQKAQAAAWSFYPTKNLGAMGDAGAVTTNIESIAQTVRQLADYRNADGINARMDSLQAAILRAKLPSLETNNEIRAQQAAYYNRRLRSLWSLQNWPIAPDGWVGGEGFSSTGWHQYVIRCRGGERDALKLHLARHGIETLIHYKEPGSAYIGLYPAIAVALCETLLSLPLGSHLTPDHLAHVTEQIELFYKAMEEVN